jgi:hypothetical protein
MSRGSLPPIARAPAARMTGRAGEQRAARPPACERLRQVRDAPASARRIPLAPGLWVLARTR